MSRITRVWVAGVLGGMLWFGTVQGQGDDHSDKGGTQKVSPAPQPKREAGPGSKNKLVSVELVIAEVASKAEAAKPGAAEKELDARDLTGPMGQVLARIETLKKTGRISYLRRIQLSVTEGQQAVVNIGAMKPVTSGSTFTATGIAARNISYHNTGTTVKITPLITSENRVMIDFSLEDSRMRVPEDRFSPGTDEKKQSVPAAEFATAKLDSKLSVRSGQALAAQVVQTVTKTGQEQLFVVVAARVAESEGQGDK
jgi:type II secretory pathway component GspD/PulD (secretin)